MLAQIERLCQEEDEDRSSIIRKLVFQGYLDFVRDKAIRKYLDGKITLSEAAHQAGLTLWEAEKHLVDHGFKSDYSLEDLEKELALLEK